MKQFDISKTKSNLRHEIDIPGKQKHKIDLYRIGCYEINKNNKLGTGTYSTVYAGISMDQETNRKYNIKDGIVAIKKISLLNISEKTSKMIKEEISIMERIKKNPHPNIITCIDIIEDTDTVYIVMEYCDSGDLNKLLGTPIKEDVVKFYFKQIVEGLVYMTENKIIHRDIKPKNILLTNNKTCIKICDFGLAKGFKDGLTRALTVCGSPLYMAPEILGEKSYSIGVDIWSIGMILHEMLFGYHPFYKCKDINELKTSVMNNSTIISPKKKYQLSDNCLDLISKLLEKEETKRINLKDIGSHSWIYNCNESNAVIRDKLFKSTKDNMNLIIYVEQSYKKIIVDDSDSDDDYYKISNPDKKDSYFVFDMD